MSELVFDGWAHTLTYYNKDGVSVGEGWYANNVVDRKVKDLRFLPNGLYRFFDPVVPHRHGSKEDAMDGAFGRFGIFRLHAFTHRGVRHAGVGVHSGRRSKGGPDHATHGCIRTTDEVMEALTYYVVNDPLSTLLVTHNHDQHNKHPYFEGDPHLEGANRLA